jgi:hypothetical protein
MRMANTGHVDRAEYARFFAMISFCLRYVPVVVSDNL